MQISKRNCHASIFILAGVILIASCINASARTVRRTSVHTNRGGVHHRGVSRSVTVDSHHHHGGAAVFGMFVGLAIGTAVAKPPPTSTTIVVQGATYYTADGVYYQPVPAGGYVVVAAPPGY
jgi:hypothetical protein